MTNLPILTNIEPGQEYFDRPVYKKLRPRRLSTVIRVILGYIPKPTIKILVGYDHFNNLRWVKPGPDGDLIPR